MPARDVIHHAVKQALIKDGWTITADPLKIELGSFRGYIDLGAERAIAAERAGRKIAVEIKSFRGYSTMDDLENALGQFGLYAFMLGELEADRPLYLAVSTTTFANVFDTVEGLRLIAKLSLKIVVVNVKAEEITQWIH